MNGYISEKWGCCHSSTTLKTIPYDDVSLYGINDGNDDDDDDSNSTIDNAQSTLRQFKNALEMRDKNEQMLGITG